MPPLVSVIVANWNGCHHLEKCLTALSAQTYPEIEIIVVDNGSTDESVTWVAKHFPGVRLICNPHNRGFAAASNEGIQAGRGAYLALLNNDTQVAPDWLAELVAAIELDPRIGMVASRMLFADETRMINSTGICLDRSGIVWDRSAGEVDRSAERVPVEIFGACAGAALYRRVLFDEIGLFDEEFFAYLEDVDLSWRARWWGWKAVYAPGAKVYHIHSATAHEGSRFKTYLLAKNKIYLLAKNYPFPHLLIFLPTILFYEVLSLGFAALNGVGGSAWQGRLAGLRALPIAMRKRRALWAGPHASARDVFLFMEPVAWPWRVYARYRHLYRQRLQGKAR